MLSAAAVLTALLLASSSVTASPVVTIDQLVTVPFVKKIHANATSLRGLADHDRLRARNFIKARGLDRRQTVAVDNQAVSYIASVGVGSPATTFDLIIDTGSSNTWVGASTKFKKTSTSKDTGSKVSVSYGSGSFSGEEFTDTVNLGGGLVISKQSIGVASTSTGFQGVDGILGIGPTDLTDGTLSSGASVPTVVDNLAASGAIGATLIAVSFEPSQTGDDLNGELAFGGVDSSKFTGSITFVPITSTSPANEFWGIDQSITFGTKSILSKTAGIVDTGTTLVLIATDAFKKYQSATGATLDSATGLLRVTSTQFNALSNLNFVIGGTTFALTPNAQIWPRALNADIGGTSSRIYLITADLGSNSGEGLDFINGMAFLERFYSVYDTDNGRVGLAKTSFTSATSN